jgi:hypothetical protein
MISSNFNKEDQVFREFLLTLDTVSSNLHGSGVGANRVRAPIILLEHENVFLKKEIMGYGSPKRLLKFLVSTGMHFVLRGVNEQYNSGVSRMGLRVLEHLIYPQTYIFTF